MLRIVGGIWDELSPFCNVLWNDSVKKMYIYIIAYIYEKRRYQNIEYTFEYGWWYIMLILLSLYF